jgi:hypothetical protein
LNEVEPFNVFCTDDFFESEKFKNFIANIRQLTSDTHNDAGNIPMCIYDLRNKVKITFEISKVNSPMTYNDGKWTVMAGFETFEVHSRFDDAKIDFSAEILGLIYYAIFDTYTEERYKGLKKVYDSLLYYEVILKHYNIIINGGSGNNLIKQTFVNFLEFDKVGLNNLAKTAKIYDIVKLMKGELLQKILKENDMDVGILIIIMGRLNELYRQNNNQQNQNISRDELYKVSKGLEDLLTNLSVLDMKLINFLNNASTNLYFKLFFKTIKSYEQFKFSLKIIQLDSTLQEEIQNALIKYQSIARSQEKHIEISELLSKLNRLVGNVPHDTFLPQNENSSIIELFIELSVYSSSLNNFGDRQFEESVSLLKDDNIKKLSELNFKTLQKLYDLGMTKRILQLKSFKSQQGEILKCKRVLNGVIYDKKDFKQLQAFLKLNTWNDLMNMNKLFLSKQVFQNKAFIKFIEDKVKYPTLTLNEAIILGRIFLRNDLDEFSKIINTNKKLLYNIRVKVGSSIFLKQRSGLFVEHFVKPVTIKRVPQIERTLKAIKEDI